MMSHELPAHPNLEHLKNQGKALLRDYQQDDAAAKERFAVVATVSSRPKLADALHVVAHEYGFASWPKLKQHVESVTRVFPSGRARGGGSRRRRGPGWDVLERNPELKAHLDEPMANYGAGMTPLLAAVQRTDRKTIDVLLKAGAGIHAEAISRPAASAYSTSATKIWWTF